MGFNQRKNFTEKTPNWDDKMSASVAVYRNIYTEDRFRQSFGTEDKPKAGVRLREKFLGWCRCSRGTCLHLLRERLPIFNWLPKYRLKKWILGDTIAGLTVGILHIPQGKLFTVQPNSGESTLNLKLRNGVTVSLSVII